MRLKFPLSGVISANSEAKLFKMEVGQINLSVPPRYFELKPTLLACWSFLVDESMLLKSKG